MNLKPNDRVRLSVPENPRLHGASATVVELTEWGAHVRTPAAATGQYRALFAEMEAIDTVADAKRQGFTGDPCATCGGMKVVRNGTCLLCTTCGSTSGCS